MQNLGTQTGWSMTSEIKVHYFGQWDWNLNSNDIWIEAAKGAENFFSVTFWAKKKAICIPWHELGWFPFLRIFSKADRSSILSTRGCQPFEGTFSTNGFEKSLHIALQTRAENATTPRSISCANALLSYCFPFKRLHRIAVPLQIIRNNIYKMAINHSTLEISFGKTSQQQFPTWHDAIPPPKTLKCTKNSKPILWS